MPRLFPIDKAIKNQGPASAMYTFADISTVVQKGIQNLQCWKNDSLRTIYLSGETLIATPQGELLLKIIA